MCTVAIHQPNFLPWLGYFSKYARSDAFVLLDSVQFPKKGGNWTNRVQIMISGRPAWVTLPVRRDHSGVLRITETFINIEAFRPDRVLKTIAQSYGKHPHFRETFRLVERLLTHGAKTVADFNVHGVVEILRHLDMYRDGKVVRSSDLACHGSGTELLVDICRRMGATRYLSGDGADGYMQAEPFYLAGMELSYMNFVHPVYPQSGCDSFIPGLSILDILFNVGAQRTRWLLTAEA